MQRPPVIWLTRPEDVDGSHPEGPVAWWGSLDDPELQDRLTRCSVTRDDLADVAHRGDAGQRLERRRMARVLLSTVAGCHPDDVVICRSARGGLVVEAPAGWYLSVAGRWPWHAVAVAATPVGVDVELASGEMPPDLAFTDEERTRILAMGADESVQAGLAVWAAKEAHAKRLDRASVMEPEEISTAPAPRGVLRARSAEAVSDCHVHAAGDVLVVVATAPAEDSLID